MAANARFLLVVAASLLPLLALAQTCPGSCSGHGLCDTAASLECTCSDGWTGHNCALRKCPEAKAWATFSRSITGDVHDQIRECAGAGECDRVAGKCQCRAPFSGDACEKIACPAACNRQGRCITMREAAAGYDGFKLVNLPTIYDAWDADRISGCRCDANFEGADCSDQSCPEGHDPLVPATPEVQTLYCKCPGGCSSGSLLVKLGERTVAIPHNAVAKTSDESINAAKGTGGATGESVESRLSQLRDWPTINPDGIVFTGGTSVCSAAGTSTDITFLKSAGDMPTLQVTEGSVVDASGAVVVTVVSTTPGTTKRQECSGRGYCLLGGCVCEAGYFSSDGNGNAGYINDCGSTTNINNGVTTNVAQCIKNGCSGHGKCSGGPTFTCQCYSGWGGPGCNQKLCPTGPAWFDEPWTDGTAHHMAPCSNAGTCDTTTGKCVCFEGYAGGACQMLACPSTSVSTVCSGHGKCLTLREMAGVGMWGGEYKGVEEMQTLTCTLTAGSFKLTFRNYQTTAISFNADADTLAAALQALPTIGFLQVRVHPNTANTICGVGTTVTIKFMSDFGDLPLLIDDDTTGTPANGVSVVETTKGSRPTYGDDTLGGAQWDADSVTACVCDGYGNSNKTNAAEGDWGHWIGIDCGTRSCPHGVNPAGSFGRLVYEKQRLTCSATSGSLSLTFRTYKTAQIPFDATAADLKAALEDIESIGVVNVKEVSGWGAGGTPGLCGGASGTPGASAVIDIEFASELGDVPMLVVDDYYLSTGATVTVVEQVKGVGKVTECSSKGRCARDEGLCECDNNYYSSDGLGNRGRRGDCGTYGIEVYGVSTSGLGF